MLKSFNERWVFIVAINSESGARVRWIFILEEHLLLLYNLFQHAKNLHPRSTGWGTCEHTYKMYTYTKTHPRPHHKFCNVISISPRDLFVPGKISYFFHPPQLLIIFLHFFLYLSYCFFPPQFVVFYSLLYKNCKFSHVKWITSVLPWMTANCMCGMYCRCTEIIVVYYMCDQLHFLL